MKKSVLLVFITLTLNCHAQIPVDSLQFYTPFFLEANDLIHNASDTSFNVILTSDRFLQDNSAFLYNGTNSYVSFDEINLGIYSTLAVSVWVNTTDSKKQFVVDKYNMNTDAGFHIALIDGIPRFNGRDRNNEYVRCIGVESINDGNWHNIVGTINGSVWKLWVDGDLVTETNTGHINVDISNNSPLQFGRYHLGDNGIEHNYFNGKIDDIRIYNNVIDHADIRYLYYGDYFEGNIVYDTIQVVDSILVTDTLLIDVSFTHINELKSNRIKVYPNPAHDFLIIDNGSFELMTDYTIKIVDAQSRIVFESQINAKTYQINFNEFAQTGLYILQILNSDNEIIKTKKIILE